MVQLPSGARYWTVLDEELSDVAAADSFLRQVRFGRDGAESTTRAYAGGIALFLRWCARTGRGWQAGVGQLGLFMTWLVHAGPDVSGLGARPGAEVLAGPGVRPARSARRVNAVLAAVRGHGHPRGRGGGRAREPGAGALRGRRRLRSSGRGAAGRRRDGLADAGAAPAARA